MNFKNIVWFIKEISYFVLLWSLNNYNNNNNNNTNDDDDNDNDNDNDNNNSKNLYRAVFMKIFNSTLQESGNMNCKVNLCFHSFFQSSQTFCFY